MEAIIDMPPFKFNAYRKTEGYSNTPLDGVRARGPYLHHGAVPTLWLGPLPSLADLRRAG